MKLSALYSRLSQKYAVSDATENFTFVQMAVLQLVLVCFVYYITSS